MSFEIWWETEGSEMRQRTDEDCSKLVKRVAQAAWTNSGYVEREECASLCDWLNGERRLTPAGCAAAIRVFKSAAAIRVFKKTLGNAMFVSAAKDLWQAIEAFDDAMTACSDYPDTSNDLERLRIAVEKARAARAKAKGLL